MNRHAKAPSAGSTMRQASHLGRFVRGAFAGPAASSRDGGTGAPAHRRHPLAIALGASLAALASLALLASSAFAAPPTVTIDPVTTHSITTAHVSGTVTVDSAGNGGLETYYGFEYSSDGASWSGFNFLGPIAPGSGPTNVSEDLTGLAAETHYEVRLAVLNTSDFSEEFSPEVRSFTTDAAPNTPALALESATAVTFTKAHIAATIDPEGGNVDTVAGPVPIAWQLEINREGGGWEFAEGGAIAGAEAESSSPITVAKDLEGLHNAAQYKFRLRVSYAGKEELSPEGEFITLAVIKPGLGNVAVTSVTAESAHFSGNVNPNGTDPAFETNWYFECVAPGPSCGSPSGSPVPPGTSDVKVDADATGLEPNTPYYVELVGANAGGSEHVTTVPQPSFTTPAVAAEIQPGYPGHTTDTTTILRALVNPHNAALTECVFEYGLTAAPYEHTAPCAGVPASGGELTEVKASVPGLAPTTEYHYRLVTDNSGGPESSPDSRFTTFAAETPETCANQAFRAEQHSAFLPECRAYEMVSPPEKNGGGVLLDGQRTQSAVDGSAFAFGSLTGFGDVQGGAVSTDYMALRGPDSWLTHAIVPPQDAKSLFVLANGLDSFYLAFSPDLSHGITTYSPSQTLLTPDSAPVQHVQNFYLRTDLRTPGAGSYQLLTACPLCVTEHTSLATNPLYKPFFSAVSTDFSHLAFTSSKDLTKGTTGNSEKLYEWANGTLSYVGQIPPPGQTECGPSGPACEPAPSSTGGRGFGGQNPFTVSRDGFRLLFKAGSHVYLRENATTTVQLDVPEGGSGAGSGGAGLDTAAADSSHIFFTTSEQLTPNAQPNCPDLYMYDVSSLAGHHLTLLSQDQEPSDGSCPEVGDAGSQNGAKYSVIGASDDGSYVYFVARSQLVPGAPLDPDAHPLIFLWHKGTIRYVANLANSAAASIADVDNIGTLPSLHSKTARVTPDGTHLLFTSFGTSGLSGYDHGASCTNEIGANAPCREFYLYDATADQGAGSLACVSCSPSGAPATASAMKPVVEVGIGGALTFSNRLNRVLSNSGRYVFFTSEEDLLPEDTNGVADAYLYDSRTGRLHLLSSGTSPEPSYFMEATPDGHDAFIATAQPLVKWDIDSADDIYDVRVEGGLPEPPALVEPCEGATCHGPLTTPPPASTPGSSTLTGPGNPKPKRPKKHHPKKHHKKAHKHHAKRTANNSRRVSR